MRHAFVVFHQRVDADVFRFRAGERASFHHRPYRIVEMQEKSVRFRESRRGDADAGTRKTAFDDFSKHHLAGIGLKQDVFAAPDGADGSGGFVATEADDVLRRYVAYVRNVRHCVFGCGRTVFDVHVGESADGYVPSGITVGVADRRVDQSVNCYVPPDHRRGIECRVVERMDHHMHDGTADIERHVDEVGVRLVARRVAHDAREPHDIAAWRRSVDVFGRDFGFRADASALHELRRGVPCVEFAFQMAESALEADGVVEPRTTPVAEVAARIPHFVYRQNIRAVGDLDPPVSHSGIAVERYHPAFEVERAVRAGRGAADLRHLAETCQRFRVRRHAKDGDGSCGQDGEKGFHDANQWC